MAAPVVVQSASLYVGDLDPDVTEAMLYEIFNAVGPVGSIRICRDSVSRRSLGYGYVNYHQQADADKALDTLNFSSIKNRACRIMWSQRDPSLRRSGLGNIFVKNLDQNIDNKALYDTFSLFGNILSCKVACDSTGKSRGYGFVHYEAEESAKQAIERVNGMKIGDKTVEVYAHEKKDHSATNFTNIYVKNLPPKFDDDKMQEIFGAFGTITSSIIRQDQQNRQFAFINFDTTEAAQKAVAEMNGKDMRSEEQKQEQKEGDDPSSYLMYVGRALNKAERAREYSQLIKENNVAAPPGRAPGVNLYVKNLSETMTDANLRALFAEFGTITSCVAMKDDKDRCKGFGFVNFSTPDEATKAVTEMHLKLIMGKPLYVALAERKDARTDRLIRANQPGKGMGMAACGGKGKVDGKSGGKMMGGPGMCGPGMMGGCGMMNNGMTNGPQMPGKGCGGGMMCNPMQMGMMGGCKGPGPMMGMGGKGPMGMMNPAMMGMGGKPAGMMQQPPMMGMMGGKGPGMPGPAGHMGMMPGMMPPMQQGPMGPMRPQQPQTMPQQPTGGPLNAAALANAPDIVRKQMVGEKLFPQVSKYLPDQAGKITGMMLEMDMSELLILLESEQQLKIKVDEAARVLASRGS